MEKLIFPRVELKVIFHKYQKSSELEGLMYYFIPKKYEYIIHHALMDENC